MGRVIFGTLPSYGYGDGDGSGYGYGYGDGSGSGDGSGYGDGDDSGYGYGDGYGSGYGDGSDDKSYLDAVLSAAIEKRKPSASDALLAFWKSKSDGTPANGGSGEPRSVGMIEIEPSPLKPCQRGALHATLKPLAWKGERVWVVAMYPPLEHVDDDKIASLKREILADVTEYFFGELKRDSTGENRSGDSAD